MKPIYVLRAAGCVKNGAAARLPLDATRNP